MQFTLRLNGVHYLKRTLIGRRGEYKAQVVKAIKTVLGFTLLRIMYQENLGSSVSKRDCFILFSLFSVIGVLCCLGYFSGFDRI